ncbi:MAG: hypothetical protein F9K37_11240 [Bacteroidales bacterium]|nr:MAG: hypothetical protein F9K37_11240 [Bacteroidales bacterium]
MEKLIQPKVFISYSWTPPENKSRVIEFANRLAMDGVFVILDVWDLTEGQDPNVFMEKMVNDDDINKVLLFSNKEYTERANKRLGGVGVEGLIIAPEIYSDALQTKFIPIIMQKSKEGKPYLPTYLRSRIAIDFSNSITVEDEYKKLIRNIYNKREFERPPTGNKPTYLDETKNNNFPNGYSMIIDKEPINEYILKYIDSGDYVSAKNILLGIHGFEDAPLNKKLEIIKIEQKSGFIGKENSLPGAREHLDMLLEPEYFRHLSNENQNILRLLNIKVLSQEQNHNEVIKQYESVINHISDSNMSQGLKCGIYHRAGIAFGTLRNGLKTRECFERSLEIAKKHNEKHAEITCKMFQSITQSLVGFDLGIIDPIQQLVDCGRKYFEYPTNHALWQANSFKSSVQCLFAEAAIYLSRGQNRQGLLRLVAANLLSPFAKSHPKSEGYAEIFAIYPNGDLKNWIELAMYPDDINKDKFQRKHERTLVSEYLRELRDVIPSLSRNPSYENWNSLRNVISTIN